MIPLRKILAGVLLLSCFQVQSQEPLFDIVIENALVMDGSGGTPYKASVGILQGKIELIEVDTSLQLQAHKIINGRGKILTPGFIDTHAHGDPLQTPLFKNFVAQGVTTIMLGQDGSSPAMEDLRPWMTSVDSVNPAVNIGLFAGHNTLRRLSGAGYDSIPSKEAMARMEELLEDALKAGGLGLSTGLEYNPGYHAREQELLDLAKVVGKAGGLIMSHLRSEDDADIKASINELLRQGRYSPVHISHLKVVYGKGAERAQEILHQIDSARVHHIPVTADIYPYNASYTGIGILFPSWAKAPNDYYEVLRTRRSELREYLHDIVMKRNGPEATLIGTGRFAGKTLAQVAEERYKPFEVILMDDIGPTGASGAYFVMDDTLQKHLVQHPLVNISSDGSPGMLHPRGYGSFSKVIQEYVLEENLLEMRSAIHKMTGLPAQTLGLWGRGLIACGYYADVLLFDPSAVKANATYEEPHQLASGMEYVIVNGKIAKERDRFADKGHGRMIKREKLLKM